jgi:hypothetical protein
MGGQADRQACADGERGPPLARAEILQLFLMKMIPIENYLKIFELECLSNY